jgi:hypothetical protein
VSPEQAATDFLDATSRPIATAARDYVIGELRRAGGPFVMGACDDGTPVLLAVSGGTRLLTYRVHGEAIDSADWGDVRGATLERRRELVGGTAFMETRWTLKHPILPRSGSVEIDLTYIPGNERDAL